MVFGSHERVLAMDGDYIYVSTFRTLLVISSTGLILTFARMDQQIIPSTTKALLDSPKTSSYHIKTVRECSMPKKDSSAVRLVIQRDDSSKKRYDFEADSHTSAGGFSIRFPVFSSFPSAPLSFYVRCHYRGSDTFFSSDGRIVCLNYLNLHSCSGDCVDYQDDAEGV